MSRCRNRNASSPANSGRSGRISSLRARASRRVGTCAAAPSGRQPHDRAAVEHLALHRAALDHGALLGVQPVQPGREQQLDRRRHRDVARGPRWRPTRPSSGGAGRRRSASRASPRRTAGCPRPPPGSGRARVGGQSSAPSRLSTSSMARLAGRAARAAPCVAFSLPPPQPGRSSSSSGRAMHSSRIGASRVQSATCSIRSRNAGSAQWMSSNTTTSGARAPGARGTSGPPRTSSSRATGSTHADEAGAAAASRPPASVEDGRRSWSRAARGGSSSDRRSGRLVHHLGQRAERDALAVGQASAAQDRRGGGRARRNSRTRRDFPTPAGPSSVNRCAVRSATRARKARSRSCSSARGRPSASPGGGRAPRRPRGRPSRRYAGTGSALPFSSSGSTGSTVDGVAHQPVGRLAEEDLAGLGAPAPGGPRR